MPSRKIDLSHAAIDQCVILATDIEGRMVDPTGVDKRRHSNLGHTLLFRNLRRFGIRHIFCFVTKLTDEITAAARAADQRHDIDLTIVTAAAPLGTAGLLRHIADKLDTRFFVLDGASLFDINILDLIPLLADTPTATLAMALRWVDDASDMVIVEVDGAQVLGFRQCGDSSGGLVDAGLYLADKSQLGTLPVRSSLRDDVLPHLARVGAVCGRRYKGAFFDLRAPDASASTFFWRPAVFFDRDGVLNVDHGYVGSFDRFEWTRTARDAIKFVNDSGWFAFVVTNQSGVARGYYSEADVERLHDYMQLELRSTGAHLDDIRFCPFHPEGTVPGYGIESPWRKPEPGMILDLLAHYPIDLGRSIMVGDSASDIEAAKRAGIRGLLFDNTDLKAFLKSEMPEAAA